MNRPRVRKARGWTKENQFLLPDPNVTGVALLLAYLVSTAMGMMEEEEQST